MKVFYKDGREPEVTADAADLVGFEEHFDIGVSEMLMGDTIRHGHLYYLSWLASKTAVEYKEWLTTVRDVDPVWGGATAPLADAPSAGS